MTTGKISAKNGIILINGYNFSTYFNSYDIENSVNPVDVTGFTDASKNMIPSILSGKISGNVFWDSAAAKTHLALSVMPTGYVTVLPEGYTLGNPSFSLPFMSGRYGVKGAPDAALEIGTLDFESYGANVGVEMGWALQHGTITNTLTGTGFDDPSGAAVTATCSATLHIWQACAADTYVVKVQHSTALGSGYADLITFTANGSAITAERQAVASGTINRYRRILATRTGSAGNTFGFSVHFQHQ
jgi:hypothetical protein